MAYARRRSSSRRRTSVRRSAPARSYRSRAVRSRRTSRRAAGGARTIRIEVVNATPGAVARPEIGMKPAPSPRKAAF